MALWCEIFSHGATRSISLIHGKGFSPKYFVFRVFSSKRKFLNSEDKKLLVLESPDQLRLVFVLGLR